MLLVFLRWMISFCIFMRLFFRLGHPTQDFRHTHYISRCAVRHMSHCTWPEVVSNLSRQHHMVGHLLPVMLMLRLLLPLVSILIITMCILWRCSRAVRQLRTSLRHLISTMPLPLLCHRQRTINCTISIPVRHCTRSVTTCIHIPSTIVNNSSSRHTASI